MYTSQQYSLGSSGPGETQGNPRPKIPAKGLYCGPVRIFVATAGCSVRSAQARRVRGEGIAYFRNSGCLDGRHANHQSPPHCLHLMPSFRSGECRVGKEPTVPRRSPIQKYACTRGTQDRFDGTPHLARHNTFACHPGKKRLMC